MTVELYRNPIQRHGDFADPFVLRHDGRYYLYGTNPDIRCWSSDDLVAWTLEGPTIADDAFPGLVPFAPEVVYADGAFHMYTSPSGHGHFVLRADAPTGPFRAVTGNVGHAIDGNVFIDDDGRWYFYWAGDEGIWGCEMSSPTEFGEPVLTAVHMNGWTEGPFVSKREGVYFMTLTGNHYLSDGYRIDAASSDHPLHGWVADPRNPILVETEGERIGLGHSSSVRGPDLVSTYLVYHNMNPDLSRDLDIDRQVWDGRGIRVLGPTSSAPVPAAADAVSRGVCELPVGEVFTAEANLTASTGSGVYGLELTGPARVALSLTIDRTAGEVRAVRDGSAFASAPLPGGFVHEALHCWRVEVDGSRLRLFLDGRAQFAIPFAGAPGSVLGTIGDGLRVGHCAATATTPDAADRDAVVPLPGAFPATVATDGRLTRRIHVQHPGEVAVYLDGGPTADGPVTVAIDGADPVELVPRGGGVRSARLPLPGEAQTLTLQASGGNDETVLVTVAPAPSRESARIGETDATGWGKTVVDDRLRDDVTVTATLTVTPEEPGGHADLLLRATQLSEGGEGDDTRLGIHFLRGYSVQLHADRIVLARHAYDERVLATHDLGLEPGTPHTLTVRASGGRISAALDGIPMIDTHDDLPHHTGRIGIRTAGAALHLHDLHIDPNDSVH